jgi:glycosyltransferase involved in cell wall biosynthesis
MTEIVRPGITGFLAADVEAAVDAVHALDTIDRRDCRADARERFSAERMVADYERLFQSIIDQGQRP